MKPRGIIAWQTDWQAGMTLDTSRSWLLVPGNYSRDDLCLTKNREQLFILLTIAKLTSTSPRIRALHDLLSATIDLTGPAS
jgi:hypothetical protein